MELPEGYRKLADAIILQAVRDYRKALRGLKRNPSHEQSKYRKREIESFFRSQWFKDLCDINGEMMIRKLQKEVIS